MTKMNLLPDALQPYKRCLESGPHVLNDAELLAVILRTGTVGVSAVEMTTALLEYAGKQGLGILYSASVKQLLQIHGIGEVKAVQLLCIGELSKRISRTLAFSQLDLNNPRTIADYYMEETKHLKREEVRVMFLDVRYGLITDRVLSSGTVNASIISPREVFLEALKYEAVHIILLHNHPSGNPKPSREDFILTKRMCDAGELLGITVMDHIILGNNCYYSFAEHHALTGCLRGVGFSER